MDGLYPVHSPSRNSNSLFWGLNISMGLVLISPNRTNPSSDGIHKGSMEIVSRTKDLESSSSTTVVLPCVLVLILYVSMCHGGGGNSIVVPSATVNAADELPNDITIAVNAESVMVGVEYQWLPSSCQICNVFGHTCRPKVDTKTPPPGENDWTRASKGKQGSNSTLISESKDESLPHHPLDPSKLPSINTQNTPKPSVLLTQSVSVTPYRTTPTSINKFAAPTVPTNSYVQVVAPTLHTNRSIKAPSGSKPKMDSSMLHKLSSNSFHVLEEVPPTDLENQEENAHLLDHDIPPDKDPFSDCIIDFIREDEAGYESPSSPVLNPIECLSSDVPTSARSKKQLKKAKKIARQRSSSSH